MNKNQVSRQVDEAVEQIDPHPISPQRPPKSENQKPGPVEGEVTEPIANEIIEEEISDTEFAEAKDASVWSLVLIAVLAMLLIAGIVHWVEVLQMVWAMQPWVSIPLMVLTAVFLIALGRAIYIEYKAAQEVDQLRARQVKVRAAIHDDRLDELRRALEPTISSLRKKHSELIEEFEGPKQGELDRASDFAARFENIVLAHLDQLAREEIKRHSIVIGGAVAVLPHPSLNAIVVLWRSSVLVRRIGEIYGLQPTGLSSIRLMKSAVINAVIAAGLDAASNAISDTLLQRAFGKVAEAGVSALRTWRLGEAARQLCRPFAVKS